MKILFAGGGTGGHLFPAIAIARELERLCDDCHIEFVGTRYGIEWKMKDSLDWPLTPIAIRGLPRKISPALLAFPFRLMIAIMQTLRIFRRFRPDAVVGTGGYVAGPVIMAAALKNIPRVLQEQNSYPGLVTRKLASRTDMVFVAYRKAGDYLDSSVRVKVTGNPIRRSILSGDRAKAIEKFGLRADRKTILILGGSQGARRINEAVQSSLEYLNDEVQLLWQCGKRDYKEQAARLSKKDFVISLFPFSDDMDLVYAAADLAVARAGALTIAELTACGLPSLLIPFPHATADHQTHNAADIVAAGAAEMIADADLDNMNLLEQAVELVTSDRRQAMAEASRKLGRPEAATEIAREVLQLAGLKGEAIDLRQQDRID
ncbi:MAG: undecaprenyldiphospho-muramoylpentapeptide beta-N-acetylglucosaminyltransferase [FCB group bacterium]|nr:undecaprenyldiphospho-muramoylpentapeptide beta-N-acetylglucosaminyltransferase [FCB group bacterium]